jgi:hypothetical protein
MGSPEMAVIFRAACAVSLLEGGVPMERPRLVIDVSAFGVEEVVIKVPHGRREEGLRLLERSLTDIAALDRAARQDSTDDDRNRPEPS